MAIDLDSLGQNLAKNVAALRRSLNLTQSELSNRSGLPRSTLTNLESGAANPSLANLAKLASALQVSIEELLRRPRADCQLLKASELSSRTYDRGRFAVYDLLPEALPGFELDRMVIQVGGRKQGVPHLAGTKEYLTVVEGSVAVYVAGENFLVAAGDVLAFPGDQAHSYRNAGESEAVCYSVVAWQPRSPGRT